MKIRSLLLGSAAASMLAVSGAQAADIYIPEPEPQDYVRICSVYGTGFFYIPGTETCLRVGGYMRYEFRGNDYGAWNGGSRTWSFSRFQLNVDARSETEWGTLRGYAEGRWDYTTGVATTTTTLTGGTIVGGVFVPTTTTSTTVGSTDAAYINQVFIELIQDAGTLRLGKSDTPYARFLDYGTFAGPFDSSYAFNNAAELSYLFDLGNGFEAIIAAVDIAGSQKFDAGIEGGAKYTFAPGTYLGVIAGYDTFADEWGVRAAARASLEPIEVGLLGFYSSGSSIYAITNPAGGVSEWSATGYVYGTLTPEVRAFVQAQWFDDTPVASDTWRVAGGFDLRPFGDTSLRIRPEVQYTSNIKTWDFGIRFDRNF